MVKSAKNMSYFGVHVPVEVLTRAEALPSVDSESGMQAKILAALFSARVLRALRHRL
jgi:hypothetical protein